MHIASGAMHLMFVDAADDLSLHRRGQLAEAHLEGRRPGAMARFQQVAAQATEGEVTLMGGVDDP